MEPQLVVPARNAREVIVRAKDATPDIRNRAAKDTLEAINKAIGSDAAVAARKMPSGDIVVTFRDAAEKHTTGLVDIRRVWTSRRGDLTRVRRTREGHTSGTAKGNLEPTLGALGYKRQGDHEG